MDFRITPGTPWPPGRQAVAVGAATVAFVTAVLAVALSSERGLTLAVAAVYVALTVTATRTPTLVAEQTVTGVAVAWATLVGTDPVVWGIVPLVTGVVASSELLGLAGRLGVVVPRSAAAGVRRATIAAVLALTMTSATLTLTLLVGR